MLYVSDEKASYAHVEGLQSLWEQTVRGRNPASGTDGYSTCFLTNPVEEADKTMFSVCFFNQTSGREWIGIMMFSLPVSGM